MAESLVNESLEWRSVLEALRKMPVEMVRDPLSKRKAVIAYTDGACITNPGGPAGWSVILFSTDDLSGDALLRAQQDSALPPIECYGHIPKAPTTTNNRAEISAVLAALCLAPPELPLKIFSDSEYTIKVATGVYQMKANPDLWERFRLLRNHRRSVPTFEWVRGHAGHALNEHADKLAGLGAWNGDRSAYERWQSSSIPEARNLPPEQQEVREQIERLQRLFDSGSSTARPNERDFIKDMAKRLRKNNFVPSQKQSDWIKGLAAKYKV